MRDSGTPVITLPTGVPWATGLSRGSLSSRTHRPPGPRFSHRHHPLLPSVVESRPPWCFPQLRAAQPPKRHTCGRDADACRCPDGWPGLGGARSLPVSPSPTPSGGAATRKESETAGLLSRTRGRGGGPVERVEVLVPFLPTPFPPFFLSTGPLSVPQSLGGTSWEEIERGVEL